MARVTASIGGGFDWLKAPGQLETYVSTRLSTYGQVLSVHVEPVLFGSRYTATLTFEPAQDYSIDALRALIVDAFTSWNGVPANVAITSRGEAGQASPASLLDPVNSLSKTIIVIGALLAGVLLLREFR